MKRNDVLIILATAAYSFLFYQQSAGVNYFLFNILLILLLLIRDIGLLASKPFLAAAAGCIVSSFCVFWYDTSLPFTADMISLVLLAGFSFDRSSSIIVALFHSFYSLIGVVIFFVIDTVERIRSSDGGNNTARLFNRIALAVIPVIIFFVFFGIYYTGNPIFAKLADQINLDFISMAWVSFTVGGFFFMYGFFTQRAIPVIQDKDHNATDVLRPVTLEEHVKTVLGELVSIPGLVYTGVLLLVLLNLLLATVNGLDIYYLGILHSTPPGVTLSQYLHNGTNSLILSIILAVCVILFYFRGYLNFYEGNGWLKRLSYIWIAQNIALVISTAYRNTVYIGDYGLTHKRIGVYVYLFLCVVGLITTFVKIKKGKNNWFLFRRNAWVAYILMIISCPVDWDTVITTFDINRFQSDKTMEIDQRYLADLSHTNLAQLFEYYIVQGRTLHYVPAISEGEISIRSSGADSHYSEDIKNMIWRQYLNLETRYAPHSWQSHCMSKSNNLHAMERMIKEHNLTCPVQYR